MKRKIILSSHSGRQNLKIFFKIVAKAGRLSLQNVLVRNFWLKYKLRELLSRARIYRHTRSNYQSKLLDNRCCSQKRYLTQGVVFYLNYKRTTKGPWTLEWVHQKCTYIGNYSKIQMFPKIEAHIDIWKVFDLIGFKEGSMISSMSTLSS